MSKCEAEISESVESESKPSTASGQIEGVGFVKIQIPEIDQLDIKERGEGEIREKGGKVKQEGRRLFGRSVEGRERECGAKTGQEEKGGSQRRLSEKNG